MSTQTSSDKKQNPIWIILAVVFLATNGVQAYYNYSQKETTKVQAIQIEDQTKEILAHKADIDSLNNDIQIKVDSLRELGEDVTELEDLQIELNQMVKQLKSSNYSLRKSKKQLASKVKGYETLLALKDEQIQSLSETITAQGDLIQEKNQVIIRKELDLEDLRKVEEVNILETNAEEASVTNIPRNLHHLQECVDAKDKELKSWEDFEVYEEVADRGQKTLRTNWILVRKKDGVKARVCVRGDLEDQKDQIRTDSPTVNRINIKLFLLIAVHMKWKIRTADVKSAFL